MATVLNINGEYCLTIEQLKRYFESQLKYGSPVAVDLLDYARSGDIAEWLREKERTILADSIDAINKDLGDSDYFSELSNVMTDSHTITEKPEFSECFQIVNMDSEEKDNGILISVQLKVLSSVNEFYELTIRTSCGTESKMINPSNYDKDTSIQLTFMFNKDIESLLENAVLLVGDKEQLSLSLNMQTIEFLIDDCSFKMILVEHGSFMMGATEEQESAYSCEKPAHTVTITTDYYIGETQVTESLWDAVMGNTPLSLSDNNKPKVNVSWYECKLFISKLNTRLSSILNGKRFRLPTEAEWEFAARGGNKGNSNKYSGSNDINKVAWFCDKIIHPVKTKECNELGIYDMSGNVWEWCEDWYEDYKSKPQINPQGAQYGFYRIFRGGSSENGANSCRVTYRASFPPASTSHHIGLRIALSD